MTAMADTDWQDTALALRSEGKTANEAADATGKHPATIRKLFARNPAESNGHDRVMTDEEAADLLGQASHIPGQTTVDDFTDDPLSPEAMNAAYDAAGIPGVPPEDDPEYEAEDPLAEFRAEAGEAVGPMPPEKPAREMDGGVVVEPLLLGGTQQCAFDLGPEMATPERGQIVFKSAQLPSGFYGMGDVIRGSFTARIVKVAGEEKEHAASGEFRAKPQAHVALITELELD